MYRLTRVNHRTDPDSIGLIICVRVVNKGQILSGYRYMSERGGIMSIDNSDCPKDSGDGKPMVGYPRRSEVTPWLDTVFWLLSHRRRRFALYCLHGNETGVTEFDDLAAYVTALEGDDGRTAHHTAVRAELHEVHLPQLSGTDLVEYDERSGTIRYWERPSLTEWLEHARYKELEAK